MIITTGVTLSLFCSQCPAATGKLFHVTQENGFDNSLVLCIKTTPPSIFYQFAGIKSLTPGYTISTSTLQGKTPECTMSDNGYCLFSVSDTSTTAIGITLAQPTPMVGKFTFCLNGVGDTYSCENQSFTAPIVTFTTTSFRRPCIEQQI